MCVCAEERFTGVRVYVFAGGREDVVGETLYWCVSAHARYVPVTTKMQGQGDEYTHTSQTSDEVKQKEKGAH